MSKQTVIVEKGSGLHRVVAVLSALSKDKRLKVTIEEAKTTRTNPQNAYLWGICYPTILRHLDGWEANDVHEYFLGEHFGWERLEGMGRAKVKPIKRSSKLSKLEFMDYVAFIQRKASEMGIYIEDPT